MSLDDLTNFQSGESAHADTQIKTKKSRAWLLPVGLLLGFVAVLALLFGERLIPPTEVTVAPVITIRSGGNTAPTPSDPPTSSPDQAAEKGPLLFQASGWVEPDPYTIFVPTLVDGVVDEVHALEGQEVKKGDLLATLIDDEMRLNYQIATQKITVLEKKIIAHCAGLEITEAELQAAELGVASSQSQLDEAEDNLSRLTRLSKGAVSQQQIVQARLAEERQVSMLSEARTEVPRLQATLAQVASEQQAMNATLDELGTMRDLAKLALDRTRIEAPMDGIILRLHAAPGQKRMMAMEDPRSSVIVELYDPEKLQARIDVPLNEAAALQTGQVVELTSDLLPDRIFTGKVTRISGQADLQRNTLQAKVAIAEPDIRLRPDMLVRAKFYRSAEPNETASTTSQTPAGRLAIYVPEEALSDETHAWVVSSKNTAERREIELGTEVRDGHRLVLKGLRSGESVILPPLGDLEEGLRIAPNPAL